MTVELLEIWDWETGLPTGKPVERRASHERGIAHEGVHLWIIARYGGLWHLLMQKRAASKDTFPGVLDITVGGHVPFGVRANKIQKESMEEIGIAPADEELIDLGFYRYEERWDWMFHRELQHVYLLHDDRPLESYRFHDGEVEAMAAIPWNDVAAIFRGETSAEAWYFDGSLARKSLSRADLHPLFFSGPMDGYLAIIFRAIEEYIATGSVTAAFPPVSR